MRSGCASFGEGESPKGLNPFFIRECVLAVLLCSGGVLGVVLIPSLSGNAFWLYGNYIEDWAGVLIPSLSGNAFWPEQQRYQRLF